MIRLYMIAASLCAGAITALTVLALARIFGRTRETAAFRSEERGRIPLKERMDRVRSMLESDPRSGESIRYRILLSLISFAVLFTLTGNVLLPLLLSSGIFVGIGRWYQAKIDRRLKTFESQLAQALGMIANSVRSGQSLVQALETAAKESEPPLSEELERTLVQIRLGTPVSEALLTLSAKNPSNDLRISVVCINLARETGGNMGEILLKLAHTIMERKKIQGKIAALTSQGKISGTVMGAVPFLLLAILYLIEPTTMGLLFTTFLGNVMLCIAAVMVSLGMFFVNKITAIDI